MRSYLILGMCGLFIIQYFIHYQWLQYLVVIMALLAFAGSAKKADPLPRWLGIVMLSTGIILEINKGNTLEGTSAGVLSILPLLCLVILAPLLSLPLRLGGYFEAVAFLLRNLLHHPRKLYAGVTVTLFLLSPILSLGSVRIINEFLEDLELPSAMSAKSYLVGFSTSIMWSPYFASVSLVLYYLKIPFTEYLLYGIGLSVLSLLIGNLLFMIWERRNPLDKESAVEVPLQTNHRNQLIKMAMFVVILMTACLLIEGVTGWSMVIIVSILSVLIPFLWGASTNGWNRLFPQLKDFRDRSVPMMNNEIMLFMGAGLLGYASRGTAVMNGVSSYLTGMAHHSFFLFAAAVMAIVIAVTYVGIHQIAAVGALAMQLNAHDLGVSNIALAMFLLLAWSISTALSPFSGLNLMVSRFVGASGVEVGLRANGLHLSIMAIIGIVIISRIG